MTLMGARRQGWSEIRCEICFTRLEWSVMYQCYKCPECGRKHYYGDLRKSHGPDVQCL